MWFRYVMIAAVCLLAGGHLGWYARHFTGVGPLQAKAAICEAALEEATAALVKANAASDMCLDLNQGLIAELRRYDPN